MFIGCLLFYNRSTVHARYNYTSDTWERGTRTTPLMPVLITYPVQPTNYSTMANPTLQAR